MRIFPTLAAVATLAATPCMAQVIIYGPDSAAARHQYRADQQEKAAQRDEYKARVDAANGNYWAAQREHERAIEHQERAQHQERRAVEDSQIGR